MDCSALVCWSMWSLERLDGPSVAILLEVPKAPQDTLGHTLVNGSVPKG